MTVYSLKWYVRAGGPNWACTSTRRDKSGIRRRRGHRYDEVRPRHGRVIPRRIGLVRIGGGTPGLQRREPDPAAAIERGDVRFPVRCQACRQMVSFQPVREIHVQRSLDRLGVVVGERSEVAGEPNGEQWHQPRLDQTAAEEPAGEHRAERQHGDDLVGADDLGHVVAERSRRQDDDGAGHEHLSDPVRGAAEETGQADQQPAQGKGDPGQVEQGQDHADDRVLPEEVGAEQDQQVVAHVPGMGRQCGDRRQAQAIFRRAHVEAARRIDPP